MKGENRNEVPQSKLAVMCHLQTCALCKGEGKVFAGLKDVLRQVEGVRFPHFYPPTMVYDSCSNCNATGFVEDLYPEYQMD